MAAGDLIQVPIKDSGGSTKQVQFEEQADGSLAALNVTSLKGSTTSIGGTTFQVSGGDTLRGVAADKPSASDAHAAIPYCTYWSVDTGDIEVTDGSSWSVV